MKSTDSLRSANDFSFIVVSDRTGGVVPGIFEKAVEKINYLQPDFVINVGDMIDVSNNDERDIAQWNALDSTLSKLQMPFFRVAGNHDYYFSGERKGNQTWRKRYGHPYYYFIYKEALFLVLNSNDMRGEDVGDEQIAFVRQALKENPGVKWRFVFLHHPLWLPEFENTGFDKIEELLKGVPYTLFCGHTHLYQRHERNGAEYFNLGTTGATTPQHGTRFGEFYHVTQVNVKHGKPHVANLRLEGIVGPHIVNEDSVKLKHCLFNANSFKAIAFFDPSFINMVDYNRSAEVSQASLFFTIENRSDKPMEYDLRLFHHPQAKVSWSNHQGVVEPSQTKHISLNLSFATPLPVDRIEPIELMTKVGYSAVKAEMPFEVKETKRYTLSNYLHLNTTMINVPCMEIFTDTLSVLASPRFGDELSVCYRILSPTMHYYADHVTPIVLNQSTDIAFVLRNKEGLLSGTGRQRFYKHPLIKAKVREPKVVGGLISELYQGQFSALPQFEKMKPLSTEVVKRPKVRNREWDTYAQRFKGYIRIPTDDVYRFTLKTGFASALILNGDTIITNPKPFVMEKRRETGDVALAKGMHSIEILYYSAWYWHNFITFDVETSNRKIAPVPEGWLFHAK